ncbi:MAG: ATP-dependent DNA helicase UvrD2 [Actinomycetia bacterium]|nr:ATP-dependent DNA helicase UvrD2 [Actinomycetes bacterium]MCP4960572.1 ATP-dependent DNA helicase UvrD2 [Actinomycetes bacterium]
MSERREPELDPSQQAAVDHPSPTLRILAGPGSGKTRVLTARIARRARDEIDPRRSMTLTFTRRAANELRQRLAAAGIRDLGPVGTFHSLALQQLRQHHIDRGRMPPRIIASRVAVLRTLADNPQQARAAPAVETAIASRSDPSNHIEATLLERYIQHKRRQNMIDFDDILVECARLLREDRSFAEAQQWRFRYFFVDEFQDVNRAQFELLLAWLGGRDDLCVVGDPDQAIYEWNGADARYLVDFERWFPEAATVTLDTNHRSAAPIVTAAQAILGKRETVVRHQVGARPTITDHPNPEAEADDVAARIRWAHSQGGRWSDHAVLARTNAQLDVVATRLASAGLPHRIRARGALSKDPDAVAVLDALKRCGPAFSTTLIDLELENDDTDENQPVWAVLELAREYCSQTQDPHGSGFAAWLLTVRAGDVGSDNDVVDLVTFHAAKGLEWPHVQIIGAEEGLVPMNDSAEERRLAYVAVTRAERTIHLSWCHSRRIGDRERERSPSRWLTSIDAGDPLPVPAAAEQREHFLAQARRRTDPDRDPVVQARRERLLRWRDRTARSRRIDPEAILRHEVVSDIARSNPQTVDELREASGLSAMRLRRDHESILKVLRPVRNR